MAAQGRTPFRKTQNSKRPHSCLLQSQREKRSIQMKPYSSKALAACALTALGLMLMGCQQAPAAAPAATTAAPAPATPVPVTTSESSSSTRSVEVKSDDSRPDAVSEKTVTRDSSTTKQQQ